MSSYVKVVKANAEDLTTGKYYEVNQGGFIDDVGDRRVVNQFYTGTLELTDHKPFTKADLKNGMRCVTEDGSVYMHMDGLFYGKNGFLGSGIEEDLRCIHNHHCTINKVYEVPNKSRVMDLRITSSLLWERPKPEPAKPAPKEMTVADIEEALGHPIKVVK